jgi:hypothetical protein
MTILESACIILQNPRAGDTLPVRGVYDGQLSFRMVLDPSIVTSAMIASGQGETRGRGFR